MSKRTLGILGGLVVVLVIVAADTLFTVAQTEQALVLQFGEPRAIYQEPGLKAKTPFVQEVVFLDKRVLNLDPPEERVILADQKPLLVDTYMRYRITDPLKYWQTVQNEQRLQNRLTRLNTSALRAVLGKVTLSMVVSEERAEIMLELRDQVNAEARRFGIDVLDVRLRRADLPDEISQAVYARMRTEREREAAEFRAQGFERAQRIRANADREATVILAEAERDAQFLRGDGDGERTRVLGKAYGTDQEFFDFYRSMLAYREALGNEDTTLILSPNSEFFRYFGDVSGKEGAGAE